MRGSAAARKGAKAAPLRQGCAVVLFEPTSHTAVWAEGEWFPSWRESSTSACRGGITGDDGCLWRVCREQAAMAGSGQSLLIKER